jgi:exodeoxyribonuclease VII large subunit
MFENDTLSVSALNRSVGALLERQFPLVWVKGEISNFVQAASGHWYFSLKDPQAQVKAVMFRAKAALTDVKPRNGDQIEVRGRVTLYEPRGDFQLAVEAMRYAGKGSLAEQFERLKTKLLALGLFESTRKRPIPQAVVRLAIITSAQGAALRDVLTTLRRRSPQTQIVLVPSQVQGEAAAGQLVAAFNQVEQLAHTQDAVQVVLLVRGGGSIEDLFAFNDETLAHAIANCSVPVICGVGHETDFTIADFVADARAATPTAAAELASADRSESIRRVQALSRQLLRSGQRIAGQARQRIDFAARLLRSPQALVEQQQSRLGALVLSLTKAHRSAFEQRLRRVQVVAQRLRLPTTSAHQLQLQILARRLSLAQQAQNRRQGDRLEQIEQALRLVNPSGVLERGYAIVQTASGKVITQFSQTEAGQGIRVRLSVGQVEATVTATDSSE